MNPAFSRKRPSGDAEIPSSSISGFRAFLPSRVDVLVAIQGSIHKIGEVTAQNATNRLVQGPTSERSSISSSQSSSILIPLLLAAMVTCWLLPFFRTLGVDDEDYLNVISPTIEMAQGLRAGIFPMWTSRLGFGCPLPLSNDLSFHPLMPLFAFLPVPSALRWFYWVHLFVGTWCFFRLGRIMKMNLPTCFVCVLTYLCAMPLINYVFSDFWTAIFLMYTLLPAFC